MVVNPNVYSSRLVKLFPGGGGSAMVAPSSGRARSAAVDSMLNADARRGARWIARGAGGDSLRLSCGRARLCARRSSQRPAVGSLPGLLSRLTAAHCQRLLAAARAYWPPTAMRSCRVIRHVRRQLTKIIELAAGNTLANVKTRQCTLLCKKRRAPAADESATRAVSPPQGLFAH